MIIVSGGTINELVIGPFNEEEQIKVDCSVSNDISIKGADLNDNSPITQLILKGKISSDATLECADLQINTLKMEKLVNNGRLYLRNCKGQASKSEVIIESSRLGNTTFENFDFNSFEKLRIVHSNLNEIETYEMHFPGLDGNNKIKTSISELNNNNSISEEYRRQSEFYNNLMLAMQKQGNRTQENLYYASHLETKRKYLKENKQEKYWGKLPEIISLSSHKYSSDYSQNWMIPIVWLLSFGLFCFYPYYIGLLYDDIQSAICFLTIGFIFFFSIFFSLSKSKINWHEIPIPLACFGAVCIIISIFSVFPSYLSIIDWTYFIGKYSEFILPTHKLDFLCNDPNGWIVLDFFNRIIAGYLIYQMIVAFRRSGKK
ncbi:hypothetical protein AAG747_19330 [Rapidithrix thailandica]|uniref:Uncharacterized protein n=1 Tax=Rapidithrix thailandica TaxID=413964 RepID=A0AAW9S1V0_9BACT